MKAIQRSRASLPLMLASASLFIGNTGAAHSASDAYLTLTVDPASPNGKVVIHGQWDIALRDLDFVLRLDDDGDGRLTWGEVRRHQRAVDNYAYRYLAISGAGNPCTVTPGRQMVDEHADGVYAALFFDAVCPRSPARIELRYSLFFAIDPSHRGIVVMNRGHQLATALMSPKNERIDIGF
jgi:hypothetical protein